MKTFLKSTTNTTPTTHTLNKTHRVDTIVVELLGLAAELLVVVHGVGLAQLAVHRVRGRGAAAATRAKPRRQHARNGARPELIEAKESVMHARQHATNRAEHRQTKRYVIHNKYYKCILIDIEKK